MRRMTGRWIGVGLVAALAGLLGGCSGDSVPSGDPLSQVYASGFWLNLGEGVIYDGSGKVEWRQSYVTGYHAPDESQMPKAVKVIAPLSGCSVTPPATGAVVRAAYVLTTLNKGGLRPLSKSDIEDSARTMRGRIEVGMGPGLSMSRDVPALPVVDVVVTEPGRIHLVLSSASAIQWNVVASPTSAITGITLLSRSDAAAVNIPGPKTQVSGLVGPAAERCGVRPTPLPIKTFPGLRMELPGSDADSAKNYREQLTAYNAFRSFFESRFHARLEKSTVAARAADHVAIGPKPLTVEERVAYTGIEGATLAVITDGTVVYGSAKEAAAKRREEAVRFASQQTGTDYNAVAEQAGF